MNHHSKFGCNRVKQYEDAFNESLSNFSVPEYLLYLRFVIGLG